MVVNKGMGEVENGVSSLSWGWLLIGLREGDEHNVSFGGKEGVVYMSGILW